MRKPGNKVTTLLFAILFTTFFTMAAYGAEVTPTIQPINANVTTEVVDVTDATDGATATDSTNAINPISEPVDAEVVYVRVESSAAGAEGNLLPLTALPFDESAPLTVMEALTQAVDGELTVETSEYGDFITGILGVSDESGQFSWMFAVNDEIPWDGADVCTLQAGDELVFYFIDWQMASYAYFTEKTLSLSSGQPFTVTLMSLHFSEGAAPVAQAELLLDADRPVPMTRMIHYTDENGQANLTFYAPATYTISARKSEPDGVSVISRPLCVVTVTGEAGTEAEWDLGDSVSITESATVENYTYDPETGVLQIYGYTFELTGSMKPIYKDDVLLLPFRAIAESMGAVVSWDAQTATASAKLEDKTVSFTTGDESVTVVDGRAYVPMRLLVEPFGMDSLMLQP